MDELRYTSEFRNLFSNVRLSKYSRGETIASSDTIDELTYVRSGFIKRFFIKNDGNISVQGIYGPDDCFGVSYLVNELMRTSTYTGDEVYYYEALSQMVEIKSLKYSKLISAIATEPLLYKDLFTIQAHHSASDIWLLESKGMDNAYKRVAHIIAFYAERYGRVERGNLHIGIPFIQQDIADILGVTRETVSHSIELLKQKSLLKKGRQLVVPNNQLLKEEAYSV